MSQSIRRVDDVVIVSAARTPMGGLQGELSSLSASDLGSVAIRAALSDTTIDPATIGEVLMGNILQAAQGQAPARQAALKAGIPLSVGASTVNKMCGSGMKTVMQAADYLALGHADIMVAGGMEAMSQAPYLLPKARSGFRLGHGELLDHMFTDGLQDGFGDGELMGCFAEATVDRYGFSREAQDDYAIQSLERAQAAQDQGLFDDEIAPVRLETRSGEVFIDSDEQPRTANLDKIRTLRPVFRKDGTVTPANSSSISDGAAALILMREQAARTLKLTPLARLVGTAQHAQEPKWFTTAPIGAIEKLMKNVGWQKKDVDLWEINEAFAVVTMAAIQDLALDPETVNPLGGACALGHPIGASGARIIVTLLNALRLQGKKRGVASLCIGGGEATAVAVELY